jgi:hypothetical protein
MQVHKRLPIAEMIQKNRRQDRILVTQKGLLRRGIHQPAIAVFGNVPGECQNVIRPFDGASQKHDAKPRALPRLSVRPPFSEEYILIRVVRLQFLPNAVRGMGVERLLAHVDLERDVEESATLLQPHETIRVHLVSSRSERQFVLPEKAFDRNVGDRTRADDFDDYFREAHRVLKERWRDFRKERAGWLCCVRAVQSLEAGRRQLVVILQSPTAVCCSPGSDETGGAQRLHPFTQATFVNKWSALERNTRPKQ